MTIKVNPRDSENEICSYCHSCLGKEPTTYDTVSMSKVHVDCYVEMACDKNKWMMVSEEPQLSSTEAELRAKRAYNQIFIMSAFSAYLCSPLVASIHFGPSIVALIITIMYIISHSLYKKHIGERYYKDKPIFYTAQTLVSLIMIATVSLKFYILVPLLLLINALLLINNMRIYYSR